ncbi:MAG: hypothetical protein VKO64_03580 [Candidatus Sericytochromatia bacterium]|nr:hypothetical protein [Candidatus Sericytochromatia bacterium]
MPVMGAESSGCARGRAPAGTLRAWALAVALAFCTGVLNLPEPCRAATLYDPALGWRTLATEHFRIHYPAAEEQRVQGYARTMEQVHRRLVAWLGVTPSQPTQVVLLDHEDVANGFALPLPNNAVYAYLTPPDADKREFGSNASWFEALFTHEYTHVLHFETTGGLPALANRILGRVLYPNLSLPFWMFEGTAVLGETAFSQGGRGATPYYDMVARMAALAGDLPGLDRVGSYGVGHWPQGLGVYAFGTLFMEWAVLRWGPGFPRQLAEAYGSEPWLTIEGVFRKQTGLWLSEAWEAWRSDQLRRATRQRDALLAQGSLTSFTRVTDKGVHQRRPFHLPDGTLGWHDWDGHDFARVAGEAAWPERLAQWGKVFDTPVHRDPDGNRLLYTGFASLDRFRRHRDLFALDLADGTVRRLTHGLRLVDALPLPGGRIVGVAIRDGRHEVVRLDRGGSVLGWSALPEGTQQADGLAWDGTAGRVVASLAVSGVRDLWTWTPGDEAWRPLTRDAATDHDPCVAPDGTVLYASDRNGVWNLYALPPGQSASLQVTHVLGGAFEPAISPDGRTIAFVHYDARGHDIVTVPYAPSSWRQVPGPVQGVPDGEGVFAPRAGGEAGAAIAAHVGVVRGAPPDESAWRVAPYDPLDSLLPKAWVGILGQADEGGVGAGVQLLGSDALLQHALSLSLGAGLLSGRPFAGVSWTYDGLPPTIGLAAGTGTQLYPGTPEEARLQDRLGVSVTLPGLPSRLLAILRQDGGFWTLAADAVRSRVLPGREALVNPTDGLPIPGTTTTLSLRYQYGDSLRFLRSVSPELGRLAVAEVTMSDPLWGSVSRYLRVGTEGRAFVRLPWPHHVLALRGLVAATEGPQAGQLAVGGYGASSALDNVDVRAMGDVRALPVRGHPARAAGRVAGGTMEWRMPLFEVQAGLGILPVFVDRLAGALFVDGAWFRSDNRPDGAFLVGGGGELRLKMQVSSVPIEWRLGAAMPVPEGGVPQVFLQLGTFF